MMVGYKIKLSDGVDIWPTIKWRHVHSSSSDPWIPLGKKRVFYLYNYFGFPENSGIIDVATWLLKQLSKTSIIFETEFLYSSCTTLLRVFGMIVWSIDPSVGKGGERRWRPGASHWSQFSAPDIQVTLSILMIVRTVHRRTGCDSKCLFKMKKRKKYQMPLSRWPSSVRLMTKHKKRTWVSWV